MRSVIRPVMAVALALLLLSAGPGSAEDKRPPKAEEGKQAPDLTVTGWKNGKPVTLDDLKGQVVVLKFWAVWCVQCKSGLPTASKLATEAYKDKKVSIIGVHVAKDCAKMPDFVDRNKLGFTCCQDDKGETAKAYGAKELPFNVLIDKKGNIRKLDAELSEKEIDKLLAE